MVRARIEKLSFASFRGSTQNVTFEFAPNKDIVLIFGENGTGKSSIADALDFICNNEFGSLRGKSGTNARTHILSLHAQPEDLQVELTFGGRLWRAQLSGAKPKTTPANPPRAFILRRNDITTVMEASASERYKALQSYITVPKIERAEDELRTAARQSDLAVNRAADSKSQADEALERLWSLEGCPGDSAQGWALQRTQENLGDVKARLHHAESVWQAFERAIELLKDLRNRYRQVRLAQAAVHTAQQELQGAVVAQTRQSDALAGLLEDTLRYLDSAPDNYLDCPVCGKPEAKSTLVGRVEQQLTALAHVQQLRDRLKRLESELKQAEGIESSVRDQFIEQCLVLAPLLPDSLPDFIIDVDASILAQISPETPRLAAAGRVLELLEERKSLLQTSIRDDQEVVSLHNALNTHLEIIDEARAVMSAHEAVAARLRAMLKIVERKRKTYIERLLRTIAQTVNDLYARVHPDEPLGQSAFKMKGHTKGSVELKAHFAGQNDISPTAYYSEAHLDTLGLCVYLALAKHSGATGNIVVLDDVLTSVDEVHLARVIELIVDEAPILGQVIITTHSRAWFDSVRMAQGMNADLFELYGWDLHNGIRHSRSPLYVEELRDTLAHLPLNRQAVASKAGILLEQLLDELVLRYQCRVPRKRDSAYTLGELADAIQGSKGLKTLSAQQGHGDGTWHDAPLKPLIQACTEYTWVRNQVGAHFNINSTSIPNALIEEYARRVLTLAAAMLCARCGQLPRRDQSGEYWQCGGGCGNIRLRPLRAASG